MNAMAPMRTMMTMPNHSEVADRSIPMAPTVAAAQARIRAVRPADYARSRNAIDGAVSGLSPYITHGFVSLPQVLAGVDGRHALDVQHKFVYELGWREFFRHVWAQQGAAIFTSLHQGPLPDDAYQSELPADIRHGCTGVPVVDRAVRELYNTGVLHNHARMWLASYVVHVRKVHWRTGADWLYAHLLDGDLASNHLSWQWVAGTGSSKPYLFNAENVARYAPAAWHSEGSILDTSYEELERIARSPRRHVHATRTVQMSEALAEPTLLHAPPDWLAATPPQAAQVEGRDVWLVHPWSLGELPDDLAPNTLVVALLLSNFHTAWPWSEVRWRFVGERMRELTDCCWYSDAEAVASALKSAGRVRTTADPHLVQWLAQWAQCKQPAMLFPVVDRPCSSFSQWWNRASRGVKVAAELLL